MIQIADKLWIGDSSDEMSTEVVTLKIGGLLNVAHDLQGRRGWRFQIEYAQVGLIDGPGNPPFAYCAAVLALHTLLDRHDNVMVFCHDGGRALAVSLIYLILRKGKTSSHPTFLNYWTTWDQMLADVQERTGRTLSIVHPAHKHVFDRLPLSMLESLI